MSQPGALDFVGRRCFNRVACHEYGTTVGGFLPGSWDHLNSQLWDHPASRAGGFTGQLFDHRVSVSRRGGHRLWDSGRSV